MLVQGRKLPKAAWVVRVVRVLRGRAATLVGSGPFVSSRWRRLLRWHRFVSRRELGDELHTAVQRSTCAQGVDGNAPERLGRVVREGKPLHTAQGAPAARRQLCDMGVRLQHVELTCGSESSSKPRMITKNVSAELRCSYATGVVAENGRLTRKNCCKKGIPGLQLTPICLLTPIGDRGLARA